MERKDKYMLGKGILNSIIPTKSNGGFDLMADIGNVDQGTRGLVGSGNDSNAQSALSGLLFDKVMPVIQIVAVFVLILGVLVSGCKFAASSILEVPGSRVRAIMGLIAACVGAIVAFNAQGIIALLTTFVL